MSVYTAEHFASDTPPPRIIGTEMEYTVPVGGNEVSYIATVIAKVMANDGARPEQSMLQNGSRIYADVGASIEYAAAESLGPEEALMTEMAGERVIKQAAKAIAERDGQIYRRTGCRSAGKLASVGYHQNFLTPVYEEDYQQQRDASVIGSYAITRPIWLGSGLLDESYEFSQKAHDIATLGERALFCVGYTGDRTKSGRKPILSWSQPDSPSMEAHAKHWSRLELRYTDAPHSPWARLQGLGTASLMLRVLEHKHLFPRQDWFDLSLKDPGRSVRPVSQDLHFDNVYTTIAGNKVTALSLQRRYAEMALELCRNKDVDLPRDEVIAAYEWLKVCDDLEANKADTRQMAEAVRDRVEWAARLHMLLRRAEKVDSPLDIKNPRIAGHDMMWDQIHPLAVAEKYWRRKQPDFYAKHDIGVDHFMRTPPRFTRAHVRGQLLGRRYIGVGQWDKIKTPKGAVKSLPNPYDYGD